jgi:hypothetical protein
MLGSASDRSGLPESARSGPVAVQADLNSSSAAGAVAAESTQTIPPAQPPQVPDHQLLRQIGGGSYGEVWLARNVLGTFRAVKIVYRHVFEDNRPFEREFRGIQRFEPISRTHEGLVDILQVGSAQDHFYYVMELADPVENPNLESRNPKQIRNPQSPIPNTELCDPALYAPRTLRADLKARGSLPVAECVELGMYCGSWRRGGGRAGRLRRARPNLAEARCAGCLAKRLGLPARRRAGRTQTGVRCYAASRYARLLRSGSALNDLSSRLTWSQGPLGSRCRRALQGPEARGAPTGRTRRSLRRARCATVRIWVTATSFSSCTMPEGHMMRSVSTLVPSPRPK